MCQLTHQLCIYGSASSFDDTASAVSHLILSFWIFLFKYLFNVSVALFSHLIIISPFCLTFDMKRYVTQALRKLQGLDYMR